MDAIRSSKPPFPQFPGANLHPTNRSVGQRGDGNRGIGGIDTLGDWLRQRDTDSRKFRR